MNSWGCFWLGLGFAVGMFFLGECWLQSVKVYYKLRKGIPWQ
jgi:hypothetical protein